MTAVLHTDSTNAREMIASTDGIVLVDFTAAWCPPCRMLGPVLDQLANESDDLTVVEVDVDSSPELATTYQVMSMPTLIFFAEGRPMRRLVGARGIAMLRQDLDEVRSAAQTES